MRIIIAEDEPLYRQMLQVSLQQIPAFEIVGSAGDAHSASLLAQDAEFDVALMDIDLGPGPTGLELGVRIKARHPERGVVLLSMHRGKDMLAAIPPGVTRGWAYLVKQSVADMEVLRRAIEGAAAGLLVLDPALTSEMAPTAGSLIAALSPRHLQVLGLVAEGLSNEAIAQRLTVAPKSVENYINTIFQQLGLRQDKMVSQRVQAVLAFLQGTELKARFKAPLSP